MAVLKRDEKTIIVTKTEEKVIEQEYDVAFLVKQKKMIIKQKADQIIERDKEIQDIDAMLLQAKSLGFKIT